MTRARGARPSRGAGQAGFSLIEVITAMAIVAIAASVVVISLPPPQSAGAKEAGEFARRLAWASDAAVLNGDMTGVRLNDEGFEILRYEDGAWRLLSAPEAVGTFEPETAVFLQSDYFVEERAVADLGSTPYLRFDPTGAGSAFTVRLERPDGVFLIAGDANGELSLTEEDDGA